MLNLLYQIIIFFINGVIMFTILTYYLLIIYNNIIYKLFLFIIILEILKWSPCLP